MKFDADSSSCCVGLSIEVAAFGLSPMRTVGQAAMFAPLASGLLQNS